MSNIADDTVAEIKAMIESTQDDITALEVALAKPYKRPRTVQVNLDMQLQRARRSMASLNSMLANARELAEQRNKLVTGKD